mgnify:CR=1 FL=1
MEIGNKLREARIRCALTQEKVADELQVSRQTISNWENEKSFPDIVSVIKLSDLYKISLDELLKGDMEMIRHLEESTNVVTSNKKLLIMIALNGLLIFLLLLFSSMIAQNKYLVILCTSTAIISTAILFYQIIKRI